MKEKMASIKNYVFLHLCILLYTATSVMSKAASGFDFLSPQYILLFGGMIAVLGVYAILWQQAIKNFSPSIAYSNKSVTVIWVLIFSSIIFSEGITTGNVIGSLLIVLGVVLVTRDE